MDKQKRPYLLSFTTLRHERFGALVYNRYLGLEEKLDAVEAYTAALFSGRNSIVHIEEAVGRRFGLPFGKAASHVGNLMEKLTGIYVIGMKDGLGGGGFVAPAVPVYPDEGPYYSAPKSVIWDITYACNLKCPHCLTSSGKRHPSELDTDGAKKLIDILAKEKVLSLSFSGGEPFLRPDIIEIMQYACSTNMRVDIASNGVSISDEIIEALRVLPVFQVQISIDGIGEQHDRFRGVAGAFDASCKNARRLLDEGIAVSLSTTATMDNINSLEDMIEFALELGCAGYKAIPFMPAGRAAFCASHLKLGRQEHRRMCTILDSYAKKLEGRMTVSTETSFSCLLNEDLPPPEYGLESGPMGCSAGYETLSIGAEGTAYPCPFLHDFPLGNVVGEGLRGIWFKSPVLNRLRTVQKHEMGEPCRTCRYAPLHCRGGCRASAHLATGDLLAADPNCFLG